MAVSDSAAGGAGSTANRAQSRSEAHICADGAVDHPGLLAEDDLIKLLDHCEAQAVGRGSGSVPPDGVRASGRTGERTLPAREEAEIAALSCRGTD